MAQREQLGKQDEYDWENNHSASEERIICALNTVRKHVTEGLELNDEECGYIAYACTNRLSFRDALITMCVAKCDEQEVSERDVLTLAFLPHSKEAVKKTGEVLDEHMDNDHEENQQMRALGELCKHCLLYTSDAADE